MDCCSFRSVNDWSRSGADGRVIFLNTCNSANPAGLRMPNQYHYYEVMIMSDSLAESNAALTFDNQNPYFSARMRDMLTSHSREKNVADRQCYDVLDARLAVMHVDRAVENRKYLFTIIYMPPVRLVSPVQTGRGPAHVGDVVSTPGASGCEFFAPNNSHR